MKNITKMPNTFFFIILFMLLLSSPYLYADTSSSHEEQKLSLAERAIHAISTAGESYKSSWFKIKNRLHELRMHLISSPDFETPTEANTKEAAEKIKDAVKTSKDVAEGSAKSAAEEVGNAVHETTDKMKISHEDEESKSDL